MTEIKQKKLFTFFIILCAGMGGILYGYDIGVISGALLFMQNEIDLSPAQISILTSAVLFGGSLSTLISGALADRFGRRTMISIAAIIFILGTFILVFSHSFSWVLAGRLIGGIGVGVVTIVIPLYLAESSPAAIRGRGVTIFQLFLTGGILLAYVVSLLFVHSESWRGMFWTSIVPGILLLIGSFVIIESPRWLFFKGKKARAIAALQRTRVQSEVEHDLFMMTKFEIDQEQAKKHERKKIIWKKHYLLPFLIALAIACLNQLTGINVLLQLSGFILEHSGLHSKIVSMLGSVGIGAMNFIVTIIALMLVDKVGRKSLLSFGAGGTVIALIYIGAVLRFLDPSPLQGYLTIAGLIFFIIFYAIGPGVVVWLAISELMPMPIRGLGMSICLAANSLVSAIFAAIFLPLAQVFGFSGIFWLCGGFTIFYFIIAKFVLPETKNKSLEEIEQHFYDKANSNLV